MFECPHCHTLSIAWWRKVLGSPVVCPSCHGMSKLSGWAAASGALLTPVIGIAVVTAWFMSSRLLVLAILVAAVLWSSLVAVLVQLKPIVEGEIGWTRARTHWRITYGIFGFGVVAYVLLNSIYP
jgi:hypothetical protein